MTPMTPMTTMVIPTSAPVVEGPPQGAWAYDDWQHVLPDDGNRYEIIHGAVYITTVPSSFHQWIVTRLIQVVVLQANAAMIHDRRIHGVPDLIVEVLSAGNRHYDEQIKLHAYATAGLLEYAIVDPSARTLKHYRLQQMGQYAAPHIASETQTVAFDCLPDIVLPVGELFTGSPDTTL
jgi:hypothetical protein